MSVALTVSPVESSKSISRSSGRSATWYASWINSSVVSPMAETTTITGRPEAAVRATRLAAARMRSAVASDEPPYFWTSSRSSSGVDDMRSSLGQGQMHHTARYFMVSRRRLERGRHTSNLIERVAQRQEGRACARDEGSKRARAHGRVEQDGASREQRQTKWLMQAVLGCLGEQLRSPGTQRRHHQTGAADVEDGI